jgi:tetratricopeptide (TPR) repeat protein/CHAT domain-containing protein
LVLAVLALVLVVSSGGVGVAKEPSGELVAQQTTTQSHAEILAEAQRLYDEGLALFVQQTVEARQQALEKLETAQQLCQSIGDLQGEALTFLWIGRIYADFGEAPLALGAYENALSLFEQASDRDGESTIFNNIGEVYRKQGNYGEALRYYIDALSIHREVGDRAGEGTTLNNIGLIYDGQGNYGEALRYYTDALTILREVGDRAGEGVILNNIGSVYNYQGNYGEALRIYEQALGISREVGDRAEEGTTLNNIGVVYGRQSNYGEALRYHEQALAILHEIGDRAGEGTTLSNIGGVYDDQGNYGEALRYYTDALAIHREVGNRAGEGTALDNIGGVYNYQGHYTEALRYYTDALTIAREVGDRAGEAITLNNIGWVYRDQSNYGEALRHYTDALTIAREIGNPATEGAILNNIGAVYESQSNYGEASRFYAEALTIVRSVADRAAEGIILSNIGGIYKNQGNDEEALRYYTEALTICREVGNRTGEGTTLDNIGQVYSRQGNYSEALRYYTDALVIRRAVGARAGEGTTLNNIGGVYNSQGNYGEALRYYTDAIAISRKVGDRAGEGQTLTNLAYFYQKQRNLSDAKNAIDAAIAVFETIRGNISGDEARTTYFTTVQNYYQLKVDIYMELHQQQPQHRYDIEALKTADQGRARGLLDLLAEANSDIFKDIAPDLRQRYQELRFQIEALEKQSIRLASSEATLAQVPTIQARLKERRDAEIKLREEIRLKSPAYAALEFPQPLAVAEMQAQLDANTLMLYYTLGEDQSYLWAVGQDSITSYVLPHSKATIDQAAREVVKVISNPGMYGVEVTTPDDEGGTIADATSTLSDMILSPVASQLGQNRLVIVADGALQYVPFAALKLPGQSADAYTPLVVNHDIVNLPSASTIAILRKTVIQDRQPAPKTLAVLYDPVFDLTDERFNQAASATNPSFAQATDPVDFDQQLNEAALERVLRNVGSGAPPRLKHTKAEAEGLMALVPDTDELSASDFEANYPWLEQPALSQYRYLHLATHGFFDETNPELSGLILARFDSAGNTQQGYLRLGDLFNLNLPAEMVVLSACQTALGENVEGEGIVGVTRGLMYAGAPRVVTSFWNVDDEATADFMQRFYRRILNNQESPTAALSATQRKLWQEPDIYINSPYLWAAFTLQGEWR